MTGPRKLRRIYRALRTEFGNELSSHELLRLAHSMLRVGRGDDITNVVELRLPSRRFDELGLDEALADGGWRILNRERELMREAFDDDESHRISARGTHLDWLEKAA